MKTKAKTRGGARPGAGRKPTGIAALHCYPKIETIAELRSRSKKTNRTLGQLIDVMVHGNFDMLSADVSGIAKSITAQSRRAKNHPNIFKAE